MWQTPPNLAELNQVCDNTLVSHLGICFTAFTQDSLTATMPVAAITSQPFGLLHGGASAVLAETLGSVAGNLMVPEGRICVGQDIHASHLRSVSKGEVTGVASAIHIGGRSHVWAIDIYNEQQQLICSSRLTLAVIKRS
ncbi:hotdog fold thioesterase [Motilimonas pumila]|uniref:Hotdog fold thioesterase n=1 Tax=Motilimonas pumila TaxID=2303987 RepID=A0A418YGQ7_9GAMM|nr:hotdog fold thioesterase [Motilimonas pumila]RJG48693.1 hotdog fold thioesterase [Motilimonas pumila]